MFGVNGGDVCVWTKIEGIELQLGHVGGADAIIDTML